MNKKNLIIMLCGAGIGMGIGYLIQQARIDALIKVNNQLTEVYIKQTIEAALEYHKNNWTFTDEEKEIFNKAGFKVVFE